MNQAFYTQVALWSQVAGSLIFLAVLVYIWQRFIAPAVIASQERKNAELAEAERRRDAVRGQVEDAKRALGAADDDVKQISARAERDATAERERLLLESTNEGQRLVRNANGELERLRAGARDALRADLLDRALAIAREAATRTDAATNQRLIDESLRALERGSAS
jgi:F0F1-type ATP synthase membrane subunit b/b'